MKALRLTVLIAVLIGCPALAREDWQYWSTKAQVRFFYQLAPAARWDYYRPRLSLTRRFRSFSISIEDELRIDLTGEREAEFFRNRAFVTIMKDLARSLAVGVGYVRQSDKIQGQWKSFDVVQTVLNWRF